MIQHTKITKELKPLLPTFEICFRASVHHEGKLNVNVLGVTRSHPILRKILNQTSRENGQVVRRWSMVSDDWAHSTHKSSSCRPCCLRHAAVQHLSWSTSQMKNLHFPGASVLWSTLAPSIGCCPLKKAKYAEAVEKVLSDVHFQQNLSSWFSSKWVLRTRSQIWRYCKSTCTVSAPKMSWIH